MDDPDDREETQPHRLDSARGADGQAAMRAEDDGCTRTPTFPTRDEVREVNRLVHQFAGTPDAHRLEQPGLIDHVLFESREAYARAASHRQGMCDAAAQLAYGIANAQAFRDGNRRTAYLTTGIFLASGSMGHVSPMDREDHMFARYLNGTVEPRNVRYDLSRYEDLFRRRAERRTPQAE